MTGNDRERDCERASQRGGRAMARHIEMDGAGGLTMILDVAE
jgi:hypothetical protein